MPSIKSKHHKEKRTVQSNNQVLLPPLNAAASLNVFSNLVTFDVAHVETSVLVKRKKNGEKIEMY